MKEESNAIYLSNSQQAHQFMLVKMLFWICRLLEYELQLILMLETWTMQSDLKHFSRFLQTSYVKVLNGYVSMLNSTFILQSITSPDGEIHFVLCFHFSACCQVFQETYNIRTITIFQHSVIQSVNNIGATHLYG